MKKNIYILGFLVLLPAVLAWIYDKLFYLSGNWTEDYANPIKFTLLLVSLISSIWILIRSIRATEFGSVYKYSWIIGSITLILFFTIYIYIGYSLVNMQIGG